jgi:periplasmic divalent cation tolerance protein
MTASEAVVVLTTVASPDDAVALVRSLVERRLAACGTVLPAARSIYRWEGEVADETEHVVLLKTVRGRVAAIEEAFGQLHPYRVPELIALPVTAGSGRYLGWVASETEPPPA